MDYKEFNRIVEAHSDDLYRFALKNIKVAEDAQEIVQTAFERLWINRNTVDPEKSKAFLFRVAYNFTIDMIRKQRKEADMETTKFKEPSSEGPDFKDLKRVLERALSKLSDIQRNVILLRDYEGYSYQEIGDILSITEAQVKINIFIGRKQLQEHLGSMEDYL
jgi:RNA polymerase sigma-70 factor (ECF subfamily)